MEPLALIESRFAVGKGGRKKEGKGEQTMFMFDNNGISYLITLYA